MSKTRSLTLLSLVIALAVGGCASNGTPMGTAPTGTTQGAPSAPRNAVETGWKVRRVVDGDTIVVVRDGSEERVRFPGVDTPETVKANTPVQCYGPEASRQTHQLLDGQRVLLEDDPTQPTYDQYGRRLAHVWTQTADGSAKLLVSWYLVRNGFAHARTYGSPTSWQPSFNAAQKQARAEDAGFWSPSTCNGDTRKP